MISRDECVHLVSGQRQLVDMLDMSTEDDAEMTVAYERDVAPHVLPGDDFPRLYRTRWSGSWEELYPVIVVGKFQGKCTDFYWNRDEKRWVRFPPPMVPSSQ